jgi:hypothetical protein
MAFLTDLRIDFGPAPFAGGNGGGKGRDGGGEGDKYGVHRQARGN